MIITFYSYKGGVGRSMAIANITTILARDSLEQFRGNSDTTLHSYDEALKIFEGQHYKKQVMVDITTETAKLYLDKKGWMNAETLGQYAKAFDMYGELNDGTGALQTFNDISPDPYDTVEILSDCIKLKPALRNEAANILRVVSKFNPDLILPTLNHLADSVVPAARDKAIDMLVHVVKVKREDAKPILERLKKFPIHITTSIKDRAKRILDEIKS